MSVSLHSKKGLSRLNTNYIKNKIIMKDLVFIVIASVAMTFAACTGCNKAADNAIDSLKADSVVVDSTEAVDSVVVDSVVADTVLAD